jgi:hypothetical protein
MSTGAFTLFAAFSFQGVVLAGGTVNAGVVTVVVEVTVVVAVRTCTSTRHRLCPSTQPNAKAAATKQATAAAAATGRPVRERE